MKSLDKPSQHILVQSQPWKHKNNVWNLLKVNKKDTKTTLLTTPCSGVSMVDFEQENNGWDWVNINHLMTIWWSGVSILSIYPFGRAIHNHPLKTPFSKFTSYFQGIMACKSGRMAKLIKFQLTYVSFVVFIRSCRI